MHYYSYEEILRARPPRGKAAQGEIEIVPQLPVGDDPGKYGVVYQNKWVTVINDPVVFDNYSQGSHVRIIQGSPDQKVYGAVILPFRPNADGGLDVAWVRQFRHSQDAWMSELPRGGIGSHENPAAGALRELKEETGLRQPDLMVQLGEMAVDSGILCSVAAFYATVYLGNTRVIQREKQEMEAIGSVMWTPLERWRDVVYTAPRPGRPVGPLDMFSTAAFGAAYMTGYLDRIKAACKHLSARAALEESRVTARLKAELKYDPKQVRIRVVLRDETVAKHFQRELPLLSPEPESKPNELVLHGVSPLILSWFCLTSPQFVLEIDLG